MKKIIFISLQILVILLNNINVKESVTNNCDKFYCSSLMAHATGGLIGENNEKYTYNNNELALNNSIKNRHCIIEIDISITVDDKLVCTHGWNKKSYNSIGVKYNKKNPIMTYDEFMETKIHGMFTTMDADRWLYYVEQYPNIIWFCDLKTLSDKDALRTAKALKKLFDGREKLSNQICFQIGTKYMYDIIDEYNSFNQYQYFIHKAEYDDFDSLLKWCSDKKIIGMAVNSNVINENVISAIHNYNLKVLCYTIDDVDKAKELLNNGVDCICSNFINPNDMDATEN